MSNNRIGLKIFVKRIHIKMVLWCPTPPSRSSDAVRVVFYKLRDDSEDIVGAANRTYSDMHW